jgi:hypothetical protein
MALFRAYEPREQHQKPAEFPNPTRQHDPPGGPLWRGRHLGRAKLGRYHNGMELPGAAARC